MRRKRGRNRTKEPLFVLNTRAAWEIGKPKPNFKPDPLAEERRNWVQIRKPFAEERKIGDTIGWFNVDGRIYLGRPDSKRTGIVI